MKRRSISGLSLALWSASVLAGCGVAVTPLADSGADRVVIEGSVPPAVDAGTPTDSGPASRCALTPPTSVLMPSVLFAGQPLGLTVEAASMGCGCALQLRANGLSSARGFDPVLCECCMECDCIDGGYRASQLFGAPAVGSADYAITGERGRRTVHVVSSPNACDREGIDVREVTVFGPGNQRETGPSLWWVQVSGAHRPCCANEVGFVSQMQGNSFVLEPRSCDVALCDRACPPIAERMPVTFTAAHLLGALAAGDYRLSVAGTTVTFTVR